MSRDDITSLIAVAVVATRVVVVAVLSLLLFFLSSLSSLALHWYETHVFEILAEET